MDVSQATMSTADGPSKTAVHAVEGFGKTTLACHFPSPILLGTEHGSVPRDLGFQVSTIAPRVWLDVFDVVASLAKDKHSYETVVFDTVDWMEPLIHRFVTDRDTKRETEMNPKSRELKSIEDYGYGKGYLVTEEEFRKLITVLDGLQATRGMHVVMLMHSTTRTFKNPSGPDYDRWEPKCEKRIAAVVKEWAENLLFGHFQVDSAKLPEDLARNEKSAKAKGVGSGIRIVGAQQCAMFDAKNRVGLPREFELGEDVGALINALLGEDVAVHGRRAPLREHKSDIWPDAQRERAANARRDDARNNAAADVPARDPRHSTGLPPRDERADATRERARDEEHARDATPRDAQPSRPPADEPSRGARDAHPNAPGADTPPRNGRAKTPPLNEKLFADLTDAVTRAKKHGEKYGRDVQSWVDKAKGDEHRIRSIIDRVNKDLAVDNTQPQR